MKFLLPILAIFLGILFSQAYIYSFLIKYLLMLMLFFPFLKLEITTFYLNTIWIVVANITIAFLIYWLVFPFDPELAFFCFLTSITPTATAAPAVMNFLQGNVEYVSLSVLLTNNVIALTIPFLISLLTPQSTHISTQEVLFSILFVFILPFFLAQLLKKLQIKFLVKLQSLSFYIWSILIFLASAKATNFIIYESQTNLTKIMAIAISSLVICILNFWLGKIIGGKKFAREASQSLGQKNTMFTVWLALTFLQPIAALGPMFYLFYHNLYNCYQMLKINNHKL
jgi:BASS family bile acid:Na+ symporter